MKLVDFVNLNDNKKLANNNTVLTALLIVYFIIAINSTKDLFSGQLTDFIKSNRVTQHLIGFVTVTIILRYISNLESTMNILAVSLFIYLWFILTTKLDLEWNLLIIIILLAAFYYQTTLNNYEHVVDDPSLSYKSKKNIVKKNNSTKLMFFYALLAVTGVGTSLYAYKKYNQYGPDFNIFTYIFREKMKLQE